MNTGKEEKILTDFINNTAENTEKERLIAIANYFILKGKLYALQSYPEFDLDNPYVVESLCYQYPNDIYLVYILQGHIMIDWSNNAKF